MREYVLGSTTNQMMMAQRRVFSFCVRYAYTRTLDTLNCTASANTTNHDRSF